MTLGIKGDIVNVLSMADIIQREADRYNIVHVFDDGGYRELILLKMFGLTKLPGRHGDDGFDPATNERYELKTVNLVNTKGELRKKPGITTCHHVNLEVISRYRQVSAWIIGIFFINIPARIYEVPSSEIESYFDQWEDRLRNESGLTHINNPKIRFKDVLKKGILHYHDTKYDKYF